MQSFDLLEIVTKSPSNHILTKSKCENFITKHLIKVSLELNPYSFQRTVVYT